MIDSGDLIVVSHKAMNRKLKTVQKQQKDGSHQSQKLFMGKQEKRLKTSTVQETTKYENLKRNEEVLRKAGDNNFLVHGINQKKLKK